MCGERRNTGGKPVIHMAEAGIYWHFRTPRIDARRTLGPPTYTHISIHLFRTRPGRFPGPIGWHPGPLGEPRNAGPTKCG